MLSNQSFLFPSSEAFICPEDGYIKRKRRPAGTPDPDAEVVYLSPELLMESDRYVCEICNQTFQREQNLQMHRRRHKVPWKLLKKDKQEVKKRVYVCPEITCLHHDPSHALGDLVGIKKHFRRKHSNQKQFVCEKCSKGYAVQSDYKAHLKICGTKGHSCDCGRVFSRVETFIEHQDTCNTNSTGAALQAAVLKPPCMSKASFTTAFSSNSNFFADPLRDSTFLKRTTPVSTLQTQHNHNHNHNHDLNHSSSSFNHNLDLGLELFTSSSSSHGGQENEVIKQQQQGIKYNNESWNGYFNESFIINKESSSSSLSLEAYRLKNEASQLLNIAMEQKALAEKKRQEAKCLIEMAKQDMTNARNIREQLVSQFTTNVIQVVTCNACKKVFEMQSFEEAAADHDDDGNALTAMKDNINGGNGNEGFLLWAKEITSTR